MVESILELTTQKRSQIKSLVKELVEIESPSNNKEAVDRVGRRILQELKELGSEIRIIKQNMVGDQILASWGHGPGGILVMCHMDTVFDLGTLKTRPFREQDGKLFGPGVEDMKAGIAILLTVLRIFNEQNLWPNRPIKVLFNSDEETGSTTSRAIIENEAKNAEIVFCLEPALPTGEIKTARKGIGEIQVKVSGVAAHAGSDHQKGRNAIEELAHHILSAQKLTDYAQGTTVNVGVMAGGTRVNVVPEEAHAEIDFRVTTGEEYKRLEEWTKNLSSVMDGTTVKGTISLNRPPMPRDALMARTFVKAKKIAREIGLELTEGSAGGGSDANFIAPLGVAVLDGLGAVGDGAHSDREYIIEESLVLRAALLAALMLNW